MNETILIYGVVLGRSIWLYDYGGVWNGEIPRLWGDVLQVVDDEFTTTAFEMSEL